MNQSQSQSGHRGWGFWVQILIAFTGGKSLNGITNFWLGVGKRGGERAREKCRE